MGRNWFLHNLRFPAVSCENLWFSAVLSATPTPLISRFSRKREWEVPGRGFSPQLTSCVFFVRKSVIEKEFSLELTLRLPLRRRV